MTEMPPTSSLMHREWQAWRVLCKELEKHGININDQELLCGRIREWGEWLAQLRNVGDPSHFGMGLSDACEQIIDAGGQIASEAFKEYEADA